MTRSPAGVAFYVFSTVDVLRIQSHLITQGRDEAAGVLALQGEWRRFLDEVVAMDYRLSITELDVRDNNLLADPVVRDCAVADFTRGHCDVMLAYPQLRDVLAWGMSDRYSWIEGFEPRKDATQRRPCPYDAAQRRPDRALRRRSLSRAAAVLPNIPDRSGRRTPN